MTSQAPEPRSAETPAGFEVFVKPPRRGTPRSRPIRHGTIGGYQTHRHRKERPCDACRAARNADARARYAAQVAPAAEASA